MKAFCPKPFFEKMRNKQIWTKIEAHMAQFSRQRSDYKVDDKARTVMLDGKCMMRQDTTTWVVSLLD